MGESVFGPGMDLEGYLAKRALEIQNLEQRKLFKDVVEKLLMELYRYSQEQYNALEKRVFGEVASPQSGYAIYIGLTDRARYDATDPFLQPILPSDTDQRVHLLEELWECVRNGRSYPLYRVFLEADYQTVQAFSVPGHIYCGVVRTDRGQYQAKCTVRPDTAYLQRVEELYQIFSLNYLPWSTVCTAYLHKFFQVELVSVDDLDPKETIQKISIDFEGYSHAIHYDYIPLWNLTPILEKTSTYPEPCVDRITYDHRIFSHQLDRSCQYLVADADVELDNIRRLNGDLVITCPEGNPRQWRLYRVSQPQGWLRFPYPVLSNLSKESFAGNLCECYRRGIKTKGEIARLLASYDYGDYVSFHAVSLEPRQTKTGQTYNMDEFLFDELRTEQGEWSMILYFSSNRPEHFLTLDIMSFLVSQVQRLFPEYLCQGKLI